MFLFDFGAFRWFNSRMPEYIPDPSGLSTVQLNKQRGFKTGLYTNPQMFDPATFPNGLNDWDTELRVVGYWGTRGVNSTYINWTKADPACITRGDCIEYITDWNVVKEKCNILGNSKCQNFFIQYLHAGSDEWIDLYSEKMKNLSDIYGFDYLYQDTAGYTWGSSGKIDGRENSEGVKVLESEIKRKSPDSAIGGEYLTEIGVANEDLVIMGVNNNWDDAGYVRGKPDRARPFLSYILQDYLRFWQIGGPSFISKSVEEIQQNYVPHISGGSGLELNLENPSGLFRISLEEARLKEQGYRPYYPDVYENKVVSYLRNDNGEIIKYKHIGKYIAGQSNPFVGLCLKETTEGDKLIYGRITGLRNFSYSESVIIDNWRL